MDTVISGKGVSNMEMVHKLSQRLITLIALDRSVSIPAMRINHQRYPHLRPLPVPFSLPPPENLGNFQNKYHVNQAEYASRMHLEAQCMNLGCRNGLFLSSAENGFKMHLGLHVDESLDSSPKWANHTKVIMY